jgi:hypothetical protein
MDDIFYGIELGYQDKRRLYQVIRKLELERRNKLLHVLKLRRIIFKQKFKHMNIRCIPLHLRRNFSYQVKREGK